MLNQNKGSDDRLSGKQSCVDWIVDSGASHHMTGNIELLSNVRDLTSIPVWLPDGNSAVAVKEGKLSIGGGFCLEHVLFVPKMTCTLFLFLSLQRI